jgi:hypothetical protein
VQLGRALRSALAEALGVRSEQRALSLEKRASSYTGCIAMVPCSARPEKHAAAEERASFGST